MGKGTFFLFPPCVLHGFVHPGKILRHLRWMQEQTKSSVLTDQTLSWCVRALNPWWCGLSGQATVAVALSHGAKGVCHVRVEYKSTNIYYDRLHSYGPSVVPTHRPGQHSMSAVELEAIPVPVVLAAAPQRLRQSRHVEATEYRRFW